MIKLFGIGTALVGIAHFIVPDQFRAATRIAFPDNTDEAIMQNGAIETALGAAIAVRKTRKLGFVGLLAYGGWLGFNASKNV